jgi:hypothetical protein
MMVRSLFSFLLLSGLSLNAAPFYLTAPPKGWECIADAKQLPQKVKVIFVGAGHGNSQFTPSINVACEETPLSLKDYVAQAKHYHEDRTSTFCSYLGNVQTIAGPAEVLQIDRSSQWGDIRFVQAMLIKEGQAYVVTSTCLKNEFGMLSSSIFKAIQSFSLPPK